MNKSASDSKGSTTISVRVDRTVKARLEAIAKGAKRSKSFLASEALEEYISVQEWQLRGIKEAITSLERGEGIAHHTVEKWIRSIRRT